LSKIFLNGVLIFLAISLFLMISVTKSVRYKKIMYHVVKDWKRFIAEDTPFYFREQALAKIADLAK